MTAAAPPGEVWTCRSCKAPIRWVQLADSTGDRKPHPIDAEPETGNIAVARFPDGLLYGRICTPADPILAAERRCLSHFATCPSAAQHRRPR